MTMVIGFILTFSVGVGMFVTAQTALHAIEGGVLLVISAVFFRSLGIIHAIQDVHATIAQCAFTDQE